LSFSLQASESAEDLEPAAELHSSPRWRSAASTAKCAVLPASLMYESLIVKIFSLTS
jgi:hypothetical protein